MLLAAITLPGLTALLVLLGEHVDLALALVLYLLAVVVIALVGGLVPALLAALAAGLLADHYFTPPVHSLRVERLADILALVVYVVTAVIVGMAAGTAARRTYQAVRASSEARALSRLATAMMHGQDLPTLLEQVREDFGLEAVSLLARDTGHAAEPRWYVVASTGEHPPERPYDVDVESPVGDDLTLAATGRPPSGDDQRVLGACAAQLGMAYSHGRLAAHDAEAGLRATAEHTRASLLLTASRDLRGPLSTADEALSGLGSGTDPKEAQRHSPPDRPPRLTAEIRAGQVEIHVEDGANEMVQVAERGTHPSRKPDSLTLRMCRDLMETMGGTLGTTGAGPGFAVTLTLPAAAPRQPIIAGRRS
ncbi:DUF4118 domain-containing protein [Streptomyces sp. NBC_01244]|uniref:DUF4118 domain-containing protein n=1 Tax=Streptomyces sp. NBC_01244 TaxID=2903797 RepID=UPI002E0FF69E|nr:DUF4118 domain-containing protein [Streptomyces sp. NBC_01244]